MRASATFIVLLGLCAFSLAQYQCVRSCDPQYPEQCPANSQCVNVGRTDTGEPTYSCFCNGGYQSYCYQQSTVLVMQCNVTDIGCGSNYPNGCPGHSFCTLTATAGKLCVCPERTKWNNDFTDCISVCPENAALDDAGNCQCVSPYVPNPTLPNSLQCIPDPNAGSCSGYVCPQGYICTVTQTAGTQCVPDASSTLPRCGSNFRCPDQVHWKCVDTITAGAVCVCADGRSGVGCLVPDCWEVSGETGCWWPDSHAFCTADPTGNTYCQCYPGWTGDQCTQNDTLCADVTCSIDKVCRNGACECRPGYYADPKTETCVQVQDTTSCNNTCRGNQICVETQTAGAVCTCPENVFGGYDCSKPVCSSDADCQAKFPHSYCVTNVRTDINPYCACEPGYTGTTCEDPADACDCPTTMACDNEGRCRCPSDSTDNGDGTCTPLSNPEDVCEFLVITLDEGSDEYSTEEIQKIVAQMVTIDTLNIKVDGPYKDRDGRYYYYVNVCGDQDVDQTLATSDLYSQVKNGNTYGLPIAQVQDADSFDSGSGASVIEVSLLLIAAGLLL